MIKQLCVSLSLFVQASLHEAVQMPNRRACLAAIYASLEAGADVNARNEAGYTALELAARRNTDAAAASKAIAVLVEEGADVRAKCPDSGLRAAALCSLQQRCNGSGSGSAGAGGGWRRCARQG